MFFFGSGRTLETKKWKTNLMQNLRTKIIPPEKDKKKKDPKIIV